MGKHRMSMGEHCSMFWASIGLCCSPRMGVCRYAALDITLLSTTPRQDVVKGSQGAGRVDESLDISKQAVSEGPKLPPGRGSRSTAGGGLLKAQNSRDAARMSPHWTDAPCNDHAAHGQSPAIDSAYSSATASLVLDSKEKSKGKGTHDANS